MSNKEKETMEDENMNADLNNFFENFIKSGAVEDEEEVVPGFKIKVKVLDTGELLIAESIMNSSTAPSDIVARVRAASILSQALISINSIPIERDDYDAQESRMRRSLLYKQLLKMPAMVIEKAYAFYIKCVKDQNNKFENFQETVEKIKNF